MLINPLKNEVSTVKVPREASKNDVISEIIAYLINNYSEYLNDVEFFRNRIIFLNDKLLSNKTYYGIKDDLSDKLLNLKKKYIVNILI